MVIIALIAVAVAAFLAGGIAGSWYSNRAWSRIYAAQARAAAERGWAQANGMPSKWDPATATAREPITVAPAGVDEAAATGVQQH